MSSNRTQLFSTKKIFENEMNATNPVPNLQLASVLACSAAPKWPKIDLG